VNTVGERTISPSIMGASRDAVNNHGGRAATKMRVKK
jgi:hypothetical protein